MQRISVPIRDHEHQVLIGTGLLRRPDLWLPTSPPASQAALVTDDCVDSLYAGDVSRGLEAAGVRWSKVSVPAGERSKSLKVLERVYREFAGARLDRDAIVLAVGGGVVGDLAGFAAASYLRGIRLVQLPTTLLAQVDSSVGGKTGIDLEEGKNLVGAFHQPACVAIDLSTLSTLPRRQLCSGLAEVIKYGVIADPTILSDLEENLERARSGDPDLMADLVSRSIRIKAQVVVADERETGRRAILNFGHTLGHALEASTGYEEYLHGEAVSIGMVYALRLSSRIAGFPESDAERVISILDACELPTAPRTPVDAGRLMTAARLDKKSRVGELRFVLARSLGQVDVFHVADNEARRALEAIW